MVAQDPNAIQREIEMTRAELADTIDAIADRVSPKRVASRGAAKVRGAVDSVLGRGSDGEAPAALLDTGRYRPPLDPTARAAIANVAEERAGTYSGAAFTGVGTYDVQRRLRLDRVLIAAGVVAGVAAIVVVVRSRR